MKDIRQRLLATFQIEHRDHIEQIRSFLATIASEPAQAASMILTLMSGLRSQTNGRHQAKFRPVGLGIQAVPCLPAVAEIGRAHV